ncbi:MAG: NAD-dependent DNA ligase LigA [Lachnospiraceae bacterium]|nr:NAD-dependent DNA ligase LigA [Lachnospiraceae bacterium]
MEAKRERIKQLTEQLNKAAAVYYQGADEIMSNFEYDKLYDELQQLEKETGIVLAGSPTERVGYEVLSALPKEEHLSPMLSLDKTKEPEQLAAWLGERPGLLSWKLDGLTIVLTYEQGKLQKAVTRGNGQVGEVITNNAKVFDNVPLSIPFQGNLVLRGEAVIPYSTFREINGALPAEEQYKNPRNLCSGSVRQLDNRITAKRHVQFYAFSLVSAEQVDFQDSQENKFRFLKEQGFDVVEYVRVTGATIAEKIKDFAAKMETNDFPSDGLVVLMDEIAYGEGLGRTAKFPRNAMAFKWADETADTHLLEMEWSASRTGLINPVAIFEPVELEGTTVSRASVHNVSIVQQLQLGIGDTIQVYKANMIIPQIAENLTRSANLDIPKKCPVCHGDTVIHEENGVKVLFCENPDCVAKKIKSFSHFVSRDAMNLDGMSEATIEKLMNHGMIGELADLFQLQRYREQIIALDGFGEKSYDKMVQSAEDAAKTTVVRFLYSLGIPNVGLSNAKLICKHCQNDFQKALEATEEELTQIDGVGGVIARSVIDFFADAKNQEMIAHLLEWITFEQETETDTVQDMEGLTFVITGSVEQFQNRKQVKELIESRGGKVTGSVSAKTDFLINNDALSSSSKNKKANELHIPILTEQAFIDKYEIQLD